MQAKNLVVVQSMKLDVSAGLRFRSIFQLYAGIPRKWAGMLAREREHKQAKSKNFLLPCPLYRLPQSCDPD